MAEYHGIVWIGAKTLVSAEMPVLELSATLELLKRVIKEWKIKYHWGFYLKKSPNPKKSVSKLKKIPKTFRDTPHTPQRHWSTCLSPQDTKDLRGTNRSAEYINVLLLLGCLLQTLVESQQENDIVLKAPALTSGT